MLIIKDESNFIFSEYEHLKCIAVSSFLGGEFHEKQSCSKICHLVYFITFCFSLCRTNSVYYIPYDINIRAYGVMIIGLIIIFGLLILKKLDDLKNR